MDVGLVQIARCLPFVALQSCTVELARGGSEEEEEEDDDDDDNDRSASRRQEWVNFLSKHKQDEDQVTDYKYVVDMLRAATKGFGDCEVERFQVIQKAGQMLYIPAGFIAIEKTTTAAIGLRSRSMGGKGARTTRRIRIRMMRRRAGGGWRGIVKKLVSVFGASWIEWGC